MRDPISQSSSTHGVMQGWKEGVFKREVSMYFFEYPNIPTVSKKSPPVFSAVGLGRCFFFESYIFRSPGVVAQGDLLFGNFKLW